MEYKLLHDIYVCNSKLYWPPPSNSTVPLQIMLKFSLKQFKFDSELQEFSTYMLKILKWDDERFKWDPDKYGGIETLEASSMDIWVPEIRLLNSVEEEWAQKYLYMPCELNSNGSVSCVGWIVYRAKCSTDLKDWPYDAQYCKLELGPFHEYATKVQLDVGARAVSMIGSEYGVEWDIMGYDQIVDEISEKQLIIKFRLERHGEVLAAIVIFPSLILTALTFSSLFIDVRLNLRLLVAFFSLMDHFYFLTDLPWEMPGNTKDAPRLLMYYRGSFIMTNVLVAVSLVLNFVCRREAVCPSWISSVNDFVIMNKFLKFIIWPRWESKDSKEINTRNFAKDWTDFGNIVNSMCILITVIVYICLYCLFMPHPIPYEVSEL